MMEPASYDAAFGEASGIDLPPRRRRLVSRT
jgi:hypothetical protein